MYTIQTVDVLGSPMEVFLFRPQGAGPHPAILLAMHIPGHGGLEKDTFTLAAAERLADNGYVVAIPFIFHWWPKNDPIDIKREGSRDDWTVADLEAAFALLKQQPDVDPKRIGTVGHCWGGRVAWLAACHITGLAALATFYGGQIKKARGAGNEAPLDKTRFINCAVIGFYGNDDTNPSPADVNDYAEALKAAGIPYEFHRYDGAGHAFQCFPMPERYNAAASDDAWNKVLAFLRDKLRKV